MTTRKILSIMTLILWIIGVIIVGTENWKILIGVTLLIWSDNLSKIIKNMNIKNDFEKRIITAIKECFENIEANDCFATEQDAQDELNRRQSLVKIWNNYDDKYSWDIDWSNRTQKKHYITYAYDIEEFVPQDSCNCFRSNTELPYFKSAEDRNQFVEANRDDLLIIFNIKK